MCCFNSYAQFGVTLPAGNIFKDELPITIHRDAHRRGIWPSLFFPSERITWFRHLNGHCWQSAMEITCIPFWDSELRQLNTQTTEVKRNAGNRELSSLKSRMCSLLFWNLTVLLASDSRFVFEVNLFQLLEKILAILTKFSELNCTDDKVLIKV